MFSQFETLFDMHDSHRVERTEMNVADVMRGRGTGIASDGRRSVRYELLIAEHEDGKRKREIQGWVLPTFGVFGEAVTLEMPDGTSATFAFLDNDGAVAVKERSTPAKLL